MHRFLVGTLESHAPALSLNLLICKVGIIKQNHLQRVLQAWSGWCLAGGLCWAVDFADSLLWGHLGPGPSTTTLATDDKLSM